MTNAPCDIHLAMKYIGKETFLFLKLMEGKTKYVYVSLVSLIYLVFNPKSNLTVVKLYQSVPVFTLSYILRFPLSELCTKFMSSGETFPGPQDIILRH